MLMSIRITVVNFCFAISIFLYCNTNLINTKHYVKASISHIIILDSSKDNDEEEVFAWPNNIVNIGLHANDKYHEI